MPKNQQGPGSYGGRVGYVHIQPMLRIGAIGNIGMTRVGAEYGRHIGGHECQPAATRGHQGGQSRERGTARWDSGFIGRHR